jgi:heterodisulfide reductase subunit C
MTHRNALVTLLVTASVAADRVGRFVHIIDVNEELFLRRRTMRQLLGKIPKSDRNVTEEIYLSECVRCQSCQVTVPMGIEVLTVRREGKSKTVIKHGWYCRAHGTEYAARALG